MSDPQHVAIIMDGNGRWADQRGLARKSGHKAGAKTSMAIIHAAIDQQISVLSLYAFSTENWNRPNDEVSSIFSLLDHYLKTEILAFIKRGVKFTVLGDRSKLSTSTRFLLSNAERLSRDNQGMLLQLAVNYGGKDELVRGIKKLAAANFNFNAIQEQDLTQCLDGASAAPVDLVIRTSGEQRLSNFMIWQAAYAELYFSELFWPDFGPEQFNQALLHYRQRERRFGTVNSIEATITSDHAVPPQQESHPNVKSS